LSIKYVAIGFAPFLISLSVYFLVGQNLITFPGGDKSLIYPISMLLFSFIYFVAYFITLVLRKSVKTSVLMGAISGVILFIPATIGLIMLLKE
jgi:hypothetical protein